MVYAIVVEPSQARLANRASMATSPLQRLVGLLSRASLEAGEGLILPRCRSIHTCGMRFPLDAVFVDRRWRVVALREGLQPWRVTAVVWKAHTVVEVPAGTIRRIGLKVGDQLRASARVRPESRADDNSP